MDCQTKEKISLAPTPYLDETYLQSLCPKGETIVWWKKQRVQNSRYTVPFMPRRAQWLLRRQAWLITWSAYLAFFLSTGTHWCSNKKDLRKITYERIFDRMFLYVIQYGSEVWSIDPAVGHFDPALCRMAQDHGPALCRIARDLLTNSIQKSPAL
jgi:hypothetical protein